MPDFEVSLGLNSQPFLRQLKAVSALIPATLGPSINSLFGGASSGAATLGQTTQNVQALTKTLQGFNATAGKAGQQAVYLGSNVQRGARGFIESIALASKWVIVYGTIFRMLRAGISEVGTFAQQIIELDDAQRQFTRVLSAEAQPLQQVAKLLTEAGYSAQNYATNLNSVLAVQKDFALQGRTVNETIFLTNATLLGAKVGFSDVGTVARALSAILNALQLSAGSATNVIDILNKVSKTSAIEFNDLAEAIRTSVLPAGQAGATLQELSGIIAAVAEATRKTGNEIGTALRSVFAFYRRPETINAVEDITAGLGEFRVEVVSATGKVKPFLTVMAESAVAFERLNEKQTLQLKTAFGSIRRNQEIAAIFERFPTILRQMISATFAAGESTGDLGIAMGGVKAQMELMRVSIQTQALALRDRLIPAFLSVSKVLLTFTHGIAALISGPGALLLVTASLTILTSYLISAGIAAIATNAAFAGLTVGAATLKVALTGIATFFTGFRIVLLTVVAVVTAVTFAMGASRKAAEEAAAANSNALRSLSDEVTQLTGSLENLRGQIKTLEDLKDIFAIFLKGGKSDYLLAISQQFKLLGKDVRPTIDGLTDLDREIGKLQETQAKFTAEQAGRLDQIAELGNAELARTTTALKEAKEGVAGYAASFDVLKQKEDTALAALKAFSETPQSGPEIFVSRERARLEKEKTEAVDARAVREKEITDLSDRQRVALESVSRAAKERLSISVSQFEELEDEVSAFREFEQIQGSFLKKQKEIKDVEAAIRAGVSDKIGQEALQIKLVQLNQEIQNLAENGTPRLLELRAALRGNSEFTAFLAQMVQLSQIRIRGDVVEKDREFRVSSITSLLEVQLRVQRELAQAEEDRANLAREAEILTNIRTRKLTESVALDEEITLITGKRAAIYADLNRRQQQNSRLLGLLEKAESGTWAIEKDREETKLQISLLTKEEVDALQRVISYDQLLLALGSKRTQLEIKRLETLERGADAVKLRTITDLAGLEGLRETERIDLQINQIRSSRVDEAAKEVEIAGLLVEKMIALRKEAVEAGRALKEGLSTALVDVLTGEASAGEAFERFSKDINRRVIEGQVNALLSRFDPFFTSVGKTITDAANNLRIAGTAVFEDGTNIFVNRVKLMFQEIIRQLAAIMGTGGIGGSLSGGAGGNFTRGDALFALGASSLTAQQGGGTASATQSKRDKAIGRGTVAAIQAASLFTGGGSPGAGAIIGTAGSIAAPFIGDALVAAGVGTAAAGAATAGIAIGVALIASYLASKGGGSVQTTASVSQIAPAISLTNQQLAEVNRNLVALREEIRPFALPNSYYFRERPGAGVTIQNLTVSSAQEARVVTQDILRGAVAG